MLWHSCCDRELLSQAGWEDPQARSTDGVDANTVVSRQRCA
jgi:hypothetical protein